MPVETRVAGGERLLVAAVAVAVALATGGCAAWRNRKPARPPTEQVYEGSLYRMWEAPETFAPDEQVRLLQESVAADRAEGVRPPPGVQAHIGHLLANSGDRAGARPWFEAEKATYPMSAVLMDRLLAAVSR